MIYVLLDLYWRNDEKLVRWGMAEERIVEKKMELGPFEKIIRGYGGEIMGIPAGGSSSDAITVFEATVGQGGYCDTCAYNYPDFSFYDKELHLTFEVKNFEFVIR